MKWLMLNELRLLKNMTSSVYTSPAENFANGMPFMKTIVMPKKARYETMAATFFSIHRLGAK